MIIKTDPTFVIELVFKTFNRKHERIKVTNIAQHFNNSYMYNIDCLSQIFGHTAYFGKP